MAGARSGPRRRGVGGVYRLLLLATALATALAPAAATADPPGGLIGIQPQIFNGETTFEAPFVGLLLHRGGGTGPWLARCTLSLIAPDRALTAAHCLCDASGGLCQPGRAFAPRVQDYRVLLQHAGMLAVAAVAIAPGFDFPDLDLAVLTLAEPVRGIAPASLADGLFALGTVGRILGFGYTSGWGGGIGVKRAGDVITAPCGRELDPAAFVCWESDGSASGADTCAGDSGGPLLVTGPSGRTVLAAVASGGYGACDGEDLAFATAVAAHLPTIAALGGVAPAPPDAEGVTAAARVVGRLSAAEPQQSVAIEVPAGASRLVVVGNGTGQGGNDYVLHVGRGAPRGEDSAVCVSDLPGLYESCTLAAPAPGTWYAVYAYQVGLGGEVQLSATAYSADCTLDFDDDGRADALTDGLLALRHLAGRAGAALTDSVVAPGAKRTAAADIAGYLDGAACVTVLDIDGDGVRRADTDGQLLLRYLFGFRGDALVQGVLSPTATRTDADAIAAALATLTR